MTNPNPKSPKSDALGEDIEERVGEILEGLVRPDGCISIETAAHEIGKALANLPSSPDVEGTGAEARHDARLEVALQRTEADWAAIEDATVTVIGFRAGHTLTEADIAALALVDRVHREDDEEATDAFHRGVARGRTEAADKEAADLLETADRLRTEVATEKALGRFYRTEAKAALLAFRDLNPVEQRGYMLRAGEE